MDYRVWYSTEGFADFIIENTILNDQQRTITKSKMYESDANNARLFHTMPDHIKKILYLDAPDLIVEKDQEPIFSIEVSTEAGTGHNAFQRFARLAASVENEVPAFYIYPEAAIITRDSSPPKWDSINPLIFQALEEVMRTFDIPVLMYYFPSDFSTHQTRPTASPNLLRKGLKYDPNRQYGGSPLGSDAEMQKMFGVLNEVVRLTEQYGVLPARSRLLTTRPIRIHRNWMQGQYASKGGNLGMSPLSATVELDTDYLLNYLSQYESGKYQIGELLRARATTIFYQVDAKFRGDPYPGALAAIDYLKCRQGRTFEDRDISLVLVFGKLEVDNQNRTFRVVGDKSSIDQLVEKVQASENKNILDKDYDSLKSYEIPRYYMQVRYGSTYSKVKHIRVYSYFADAILFPDGALWRDA